MEKAYHSRLDVARVYEHGLQFWIFRLRYVLANNVPRQV